MIALYIILAVIALIVILFSIKVSVTAVYDETFTLDVKWLFIKFRIYPEDEEKKAKKEAKKAEKEQKKKNPKKEKPKKEKTEESASPKSNIFKDFYNNQGFAATVNLIRTAAAQLGGFLKGVYRAFVIENLTVLLRVSAGDDAAQTAIKYGKVCSAVYPAMGFICSNMKVKQYDVNVVPDFISAENTATFKLSLSVRPIKLTNAVIVLAFRLIFKVLLKLLKGSKKNDKSITNTMKGGTAK
ncbi:MAG: DUF2953 domain-containing protein [Clostridia bacterium]|nr:DUF2953 domain-containing protein [Clostridia bacterium]